MRARVFLKATSVLAVGSMLMGSSCLPENFWAEKWGEIVNRSIISLIQLLTPGWW